jgi:hypothetical protein
MRSRSWFLFLLFLIALPCISHGQTQRVPSKAKKKPAAKPATPKYEENSSLLPLGIIGIRPGLSIDSVRRVVDKSGSRMREVLEDTISRSFADRSLKIFVVDSIICRLAYMRMALIFEANSNRLRRMTLTPRETSIAAGRDDDVLDVLLLYFNQLWGPPDLKFEPPPSYFRWRTGNIEVRGYIKRGYPFWVLEG